ESPVCGRARPGYHLPPRSKNPAIVKNPPLAWWIIAVSYRLFGISPFAERLPSILASLATVLLTGLWVRRRSGSGAAVGAALVLMVTPPVSVYARAFAAGPSLTPPALRAA